MSTTTSYVQPVLIGGLVGGVLSALPIVTIGNACCCLWIVGGGVTAAYVFQANSPEPIMPGDGALVGLLAGLFATFVHLVLSIPIDIVMAPFERTWMQRLIDISGNEQLRDMLLRYSEREAGVGMIIVRRFLVFIVSLPIYAVFSTIGGLIGAMVFRKPATAAYDAPPR